MSTILTRKYRWPSFARLIKRPRLPTGLRLSYTRLKATVEQEIRIIHLSILAPVHKPAFQPCPIVNDPKGQSRSQRTCRGSSRYFR
ncbi:hypothetical protein C7476_105236 [Phyllobacterium bourgognense]|uniref:Uncharacterized protein n=1 Tax=Phyllobacterium bourgognense TaxID=314236 RepID=A0A368YU57_9HYPH|nr:hypothetical protein C7476_105236 [Phyllobacterium bourgognense]